MRRAVIFFFFFVLMLALRASAAEAFHYITPPLLQIPPVGQNPGTIQDPSGADCAMCSSIAMPIS